MWACRNGYFTTKKDQVCKNWRPLFCGGPRPMAPIEEKALIDSSILLGYLGKLKVRLNLRQLVKHKLYIFLHRIKIHGLTLFNMGGDI